MGACNSSSSEQKYTTPIADQDRPPSQQEMRHTRARDSMRFNNRAGSRHKTDEWCARMSAEDFIKGNQEALRSSILLDKIRERSDNGRISYEALDLLCVSLSLQQDMFKFYNQESLRNAFFTTCNGPSDVTEEVYDEQSLETSKALELLRNMFVYQAVANLCCLCGFKT